MFLTDITKDTARSSEAPVRGGELIVAMSIQKLKGLTTILPRDFEGDWLAQDTHLCALATVNDLEK